jgi:hypothetical protein
MKSSETCVGGCVAGAEPLAGGDGSSDALVMLGTSDRGVSGDDSDGGDEGEAAGVEL